LVKGRTLADDVQIDEAGPLIAAHPVLESRARRRIAEGPAANRGRVAGRFCHASFLLFHVAHGSAL